MKIYRINTLDRKNGNDKEVTNCASKEAVLRYLGKDNAVITGEHDNTAVTVEDVYDGKTVRVVTPAYANDLLGIEFAAETNYYIIYEINIYE